MESSTSAQQPALAENSEAVAQPATAEEPASVPQPAPIQKAATTAEPTTATQPAAAAQPAPTQQAASTQLPTATPQQVPAQQPAATPQAAAAPQSTHSEKPEKPGVLQKAPPTPQHPPQPAQPTATPVAARATSPPPSKNLRSWWRGLKKGDGKNQDTHGKSNLVRPSIHFRISSLFTEGSMETDSPGRAMFTESTWDRSGPFPLYRSGVEWIELPRPARIPGFYATLPRDESISPFNLSPRSSLSVSAGPDSLSLSSRTVSIASSDLDLCPILGPSECLTFPYYASKAACKAFCRYLETGRKKYAELTTVTEPSAIFGVPLRQSIGYANVAISLVDAEGKSYIYGYVPIVVAKCGVYLKEKGERDDGV